MATGADRFKLDYSDLDEKAIEKARVELRETPEIRENAIKELRELLKKEEDIYYADRDEILLRYLRPTKFYPESALALMRRIADFKKKYADVVNDISPEQFQDIIFNTNVINVLPNRDQERRRVLICNGGKLWDPKKVSGTQVFQSLYLIHIAAVVEPITQVYGGVVIMDFDGLGMKQIANITPAYAMRLLSFIQDALPLRLKEVHIVKEPGIFSVVWKILQPFIREKLRKRMFFHGSKMSSLHKYLSPEILPAEYGGNLPPMDYTSKDWYPTLLSLKPVIEENNSFGYKKK